jgi:hypothetical protein
LPPVEVSDVQIEQQPLSFSVDQVGVPVVVKVSYFPNWDASGALGPYRIGPNMMVVVPTENDVELTYGRSTVDWLFSLLTVLGIALCIVWRMRGDVRHAADVPVFGPPTEATSMSPPAVDDGHDPWDPERFEPHGIAEADRWIAPRSSPGPTTPDRADDPRASRWSAHEPDPPADPTR